MYFWLIRLGVAVGRKLLGVFLTLSLSGWLWKIGECYCSSVQVEDAYYLENYLLEMASMFTLHPLTTFNSYISYSYMSHIYQLVTSCFPKLSVCWCPDSSNNHLCSMTISLVRLISLCTGSFCQGHNSGYRCGLIRKVSWSEELTFLLQYSNPRWLFLHQKPYGSIYACHFSCPRSLLHEIWAKENNLIHVFTNPPFHPWL